MGEGTPIATTTKPPVRPDERIQRLSLLVAWGSRPSDWTTGRDLTDAEDCALSVPDIGPDQDITACSLKGDGSGGETRRGQGVDDETEMVASDIDVGVFGNGDWVCLPVGIHRNQRDKDCKHDGRNCELSNLVWPDYTTGQSVLDKRHSRSTLSGGPQAVNLYQIRKMSGKVRVE